MVLKYEHTTKRELKLVRHMQNKKVHNMQIKNEQFQKFTDDKLVQNLQNSILKIKQTSENRFNIFKVLKLDNYEIRHSNFLAWLLNPKETHNLGYEFIKEFFKLYTNIDWGKEEFIKAVKEYQRRERRYGLTTDQLKK